MAAYLILSHARPEQVARLAGALRAGSPDALIAVHHDPRGSRLGPVDALRVPPQPIDWGHGSHLVALLRCLAWLRSRARFDWLTVLSGQDYPLRPLAAIEADLAATDVDAFAEALPVAPLKLWRGGRVDEFARRYRYRWRPVGRRTALLAARADPLVQVRELPVGAFAGLPAEPPLAPYHGADWFTLSRRAVDALLAAPAAVVDHFLHTIVPTEAFVATVLAHEPGLRLSGDHRRWMVFEPPSAAHPRVLGLADLDAALASGRDFARKFEDLAVLDEIDRRLTSARG